MLRNKSRSVLSRLFLLCRNRPPRPLREHAAASQLRVPEAARRRLPFSFSESGGHIIKRPPPPLVSSRRRPEIPWHHDPRKVAAATAFAAGASAIAAHLRYGETVPFTGRTHLVVLSHQEARELEEADFADFVKKHDILGPHHPHTVGIRHIAREIITAAHIALDIKQRQTGGRGVNLDWMEKLDWEVIVVESDNFLVGTYPGAAKIIVSTRVLECHCKSDAEIAAFLSHEVAHVIARHTSEMISNWFPIKFLLRRQEIEADHIGMLLFAAAGFDPRIVPLLWDRFAKKEAYSTLQIWELYITDAHPCSKRRSQLLSRPENMEEALELYRQVRPRVQPKYPEMQEHEKRDDRLLPRLVHFFRNRMQVYDGISQVSH